MVEIDSYEQRLIVRALRMHGEVDHSGILHLSHFQIGSLQVDYDGLADLIENDSPSVIKQLAPYLAEARRKVTEELRQRLTPYHYRPNGA